MIMRSVMIMNANQLRPLALAARIAVAGLSIGFVTAILGLFESGLVMERLLAVGIGLMAGSMMIFGTGLIISLLEDTSGRTPGPKRDRNTA
jgi:hypothetical protein